MFGRLDISLKTCPDCQGSGKDPRKRKRPCPRCQGTGQAEFCKSCGEWIPCPGTDPNILDQSYCTQRR